VDREALAGKENEMDEPMSPPLRERLERMVEWFDRKLVWAKGERKIRLTVMRQRIVDRIAAMDGDQS
jgi:hypothetical protein